MIQVFRFSKNGFQPHLQTHLADAILAFKKIRTLIDNNNLNSYQKNLINLSIANKTIDNNFLNYGVFAFLQQPTKSDFDYFLNHLDKENKPDFNQDLHTRFFDDETICYIDDGFCYFKENKRTLKQAFDEKHLAVFIPFNNEGYQHEEFTKY